MRSKRSARGEYPPCRKSPPDTRSAAGSTGGVKRSAMPGTILEVSRLKKSLFQRRGWFSPLSGEERLIPAVDDVSFYIKEGEILGLVGESGCGKTTVGRTILGLTPVTSGSILFEGKEITALPPEELRALRSRMQMIFQDLDAALNPKMRVRDILSEAILLHHRLTDAEVERRTAELLDQVNLKASKLPSFPDELSGGEKRRGGVAPRLPLGGRGGPRAAGSPPAARSTRPMAVPPSARTLRPHRSLRPPDPPTRWRATSRSRDTPPARFRFPPPPRLPFWER